MGELDTFGYGTVLVEGSTRGVFFSEVMGPGILVRIEGPFAAPVEGGFQDSVVAKMGSSRSVWCLEYKFICMFMYLGCFHIHSCLSRVLVECRVLRLG